MVIKFRTLDIVIGKTGQEENCHCSNRIHDLISQVAGRQRAVLVRMYKPNTYIHTYIWMEHSFVVFFMILDLLRVFSGGMAGLGA